MIRALFFSFTAIFFLASCSQRKSVADAADYTTYLDSKFTNTEVKKINDETEFWRKRLLQDTGSYVSMLELARYRLSLFRLTGDIAALQEGDSLLKRSSAKLRDSDPDILFSLSQNSIMQHRFSQAAFYNDAAANAKGDLYTATLLQFDADMELGRYADAEQRLRSIGDKTSFDYLIRKAKWEDHKGNLDGAILLMEEALEKVKEKNKSLRQWAQSNLADMYGHAGRINEAYKGYMEVLKADPANLYCLKGIAWIAYSNDNNYAEAKRILHFILSQTKMPDLKLLLAEIAEAEKDPAEKNKLLEEFVSDVSKPGYGDMYNKYLISIYAEDLDDKARAVSLAEKEMKNRFTPETCDWLAWAKFNNGDMDGAFETAKSHVYKHTYEPDALMHTAFIYAAKGRKTEAREMLNECLQSSFELGPVAVKQVKEKLGSL